MNIAHIVDSSIEHIDNIDGREDVFTVPLTLSFSSGETYTDGTVDIDTLLAEMERGLEKKKLPKTSQPSPNSFAETYKLVKEKDFSHVVVWTLNPELSGTYSSAIQASDEVPGLTYFIPKLINQSVTTSRVLDQTIKREFQDFAQLQEFVKEKDQASQIFIVPETLEYLHAGGRISNIENFFGSLLNIKPIISLNKEGLYDAGRERTWKNIYLTIEKNMSADSAMDIMYAGPEMLKKAEEFQKKHENVKIYPITSAIIIAHTGPAIGFSVYNPE